MANDLSRSGVYFIDNAGDALVAAGKPIKVFKIRWTGATTAGHTLTISDAGASSPLKYEALCQAANIDVKDDFDPPLLLSGLRVATISSGKAYIYYV